MKSPYPVKKAQNFNLVQPLINFLQKNSQQPNIALTFRQPLNMITQLRNKACGLQLPSGIPSIEVIDKFIQIIEMYVRYCRLISKHFNWNPDYGATVQNFNITWIDSFNSNCKFTKPQIHFDIFCCFYNLGTLYFYKAGIKCNDDLTSARKQAIQFGKKAYFYFHQMRTVYYSGFINTRFCDTQHPHLQMLQCLSLGIIYKATFQLFKQDQFKIGIQKIAHLASLAQQNFYKAYQIGMQFFMKSSHINNNIKSQLLSFSYVQSLYYDVVANNRYAKYYENEMDNDKSNIAKLIAYQKKALRLAKLGLTNQSVIHLLKQRSQQHKQLQKIKSSIQSSLNKNIMRNKQIYKKQQIPEDKLQPPSQPPKQYIVKLVQPQQIAIKYDNKNSQPFLKLIDNDSKQFIKQLKDFSKNRQNGLQSAYAKLQKTIDAIYNNSFVNYYLNLQNSNKNKGVPQNLKKKIQQIQNNGGKKKLEIQIDIIKKNSQSSTKSFSKLKEMLLQQQKFDKQKQQQYGPQWRRLPSVTIQNPYLASINQYQTKANQANQANKKLISKYQNLQKYINLSNSSQSQIYATLPKIQLTKFIQQNKSIFQQLKTGSQQIKKQISNLDSIVLTIKSLLRDINYPQQAQNLNNTQDSNTKQAIVQKVYAKVHAETQKFNNKAKYVQDKAKAIGDVATNLNQKNNVDESSKKQFQNIMSNYNDVNNLFRDLAQGTAFYTKLSEIISRLDNDIQGLITARKIQATELQNFINRKGSSSGYFGGPSLPTMYPTQPQQTYGGYVPQLPTHSQLPNTYQPGTGTNNISDMLKQLLVSKANFDPDIFKQNQKNNIYQSLYKR